ncbi:MAG: DUF4383 domain-containing protein [Actinomycetota bacterium]
MATAYGGRSPAQFYALVFGVVYLLVGIVGFAWTGFDDFAKDRYDEEILGIFSVNPLHNIVHVAIGGLLIWGSKSHQTAKSVNLIVGVAFTLVFILGMVEALQWLAIEDAGAPNNYLHLATAALSLYFGTVGAEGAKATPTT